MTDQPLTSEERNWAMRAHLCGLLWVIAGPGLLFFPIGAFVLIGFLFLWILGIVNVVLVIIAAIQVQGGKPYRNPFCLRLVT